VLVIASLAVANWQPKKIAPQSPEITG